MTTRHDPKRLATLTRETALLLLAAGPPEESVFIQSAVPAHAQLAYLLECTVYVGELSRMVQYNEKGRGKPMTRGSLFTYPCLMAADILLYGAHRVPVGGDQDQHVELARDLAIRFNHSYGQTFVVPELHRATTAGRVRDLLTPTAKMSKSDPDEAGGVLRMLDSPDVVRRKVMRAVTDSDGKVRHDEAVKPGVTNLRPDVWTPGRGRRDPVMPSGCRCGAAPRITTLDQGALTRNRSRCCCAAIGRF